MSNTKQNKCPPLQEGDIRVITTIVKDRFGEKIDKDTREVKRVEKVEVLEIIRDGKVIFSQR